MAPGLRINEALSLNVRDLPAEDDALRVTGKDKQRIVPLLPMIRAALAAWLRLHPNRAPDLPLFLGVQGKRLNAGVVQKTLRDFRRLNGLPEHATPHALRHSFATHLLEGGRICGRSRNCSAMPAFPPRNATPMSRPCG